MRRRLERFARWQVVLVPSGPPMWGKDETVLDWAFTRSGADRKASGHRRHAIEIGSRDAVIVRRKGEQHVRSTG